MKTRIGPLKKCRCGHVEIEHHWEYGEAVYFDRWQISPHEKRLHCKLCTCQKFDPSMQHKAKWYGIGLAIFVVAVLIKIFLQL